MSLTLSLDFQYKTSMEKLWSALTDANKLTKWMVNVHTGQAMENDFKPVIGHHFQFRTQPTEYWDGIVNGEVLIVEEPHRLSYTWCSGGEEHTVTWTLQDLGDGKVNLHLEQTGISNAQALGGAKYGWSNWCGELEKVLEQ
ncbi:MULTISPECIES: SRPBCC domain-containing protein [Brevibacillus]|uniref:Activator of Hsp90 ATPase homologue 1/2-like C-terminal domain-containing protein n=1 Tax=Brevibacillus brevis (strain 47 / JCM 6285 / NBRC 100599) TaxID=358681 RepID=C0Z5B6_BREBN|nr:MULTISPECIES: SRPBCC domain-containing protein [Bacillales]NRR04394.1 SRPBCC domain-containing protein [Brevibacillus sp. RS1.1]NRS50638.1 SRPBCC domain-containing protein [Brevibacillus sp. HB2.2]OUQ85121.1 ATPase [Brevibacillus brevis]TQR35393.1 SRPBCC domain-containing protein [Lysinibacillus sp. SDF0063]UIO41825.1 SRPBCC domain-containing protein [Brevibacillus brevis]